MIVIDGYQLNNLATESFSELRADQDPKTYFRYMDVAIEGIVNPETRVKLVSRLYDDLMKKGFIDFDKIPLSKGDFTKYAYFKNLTDTIDILGKLFKGCEVDEFKKTQDLYNMIIGCRSDFEYGYKFDIELIKFAYNTLVLSLHRAVDISIMAYIEYIKERNAQPTGNILKNVSNYVSNVSMNVKYPNHTYLSTSAKNERFLIMEGVTHILKLYENGDWTKMINSFKKGRNNWLGTIGQVAKASGLVAENYYGGLEATPAGVAVVTVVALITTILGLRKIIYVFYSTAYKIDESVKRNKQFLEFTMQNGVDQSIDAIVKQERLMSFYDRLHDTIESKVFAENTKAKKNLKEANRARFSIADIGPDNYQQAKVVEAPQVMGQVKQHPLATPSAELPVKDEGVSFF